MLLLDTCTFLWWAAGDARVPQPLQAILRDPDQRVCLSAVSAWEIAVKVRIGKLVLPAPPATYVPDRRKRLSIEALPLSEPEVSFLAKLPDLHRDPFDRMLICQAMANRAALVTPDAAITQYPCLTVWD
jgi:PIN domain nuclease of toxin-antitoxin system